jgi:23S rRNA pseudouridine2605 synthase
MITDSGKENSSEKKSNEGKSQENPAKKKRQRVGDIRKQSFGVDADSVNRERNPYRAGAERQSTSSYERRSTTQDRRPVGNNRNSYQSNSYSRENSSSSGNYSRGNNNYSRNNNNSDRNYNSRQSSSYGSSDGNRRQSSSYGGGNRNYGGQGQSRPYNNNRPQFQREKVDAPKKLLKPVKYKENIDPNTPIRLNKYLANAGVCSRREADSFITAGVVKVNGIVVDELGTKVKRGDLVTFHDQPVQLESKVYVLLNKPKNCVTTSDDPENRKTVMDLVKGACPERIYPVGRLDRNTTGVLLLTNDGDLASKLMHPKFKKKKIYQVTLDRDVAIEDMQAIADGIELDDGEIHADSIAYQSEDELDVVGIEIHSGRNRIVRRIFEKLGYRVTKLDRVYFAGLTKKNVPRGKWRYLTATEVNMLRMGAFE